MVTQSLSCSGVRYTPMKAARHENSMRTNFMGPLNQPSSSCTLPCGSTYFANRALLPRACRAAARGGHVSPVDRGLALTNAEPVGQYALQLTFSDGHARGIYPWPLLRESGALA